MKNTNLLVIKFDDKFRGKSIVKFSIYLHIYLLVQFNVFR